ncbi:peptide-methionine (S)-S-oxide reductase [bacterium]|nr:peptide-methionine (S)-S-oxide reductase [bacterium]
MESRFGTIAGVIRTRVGYTGGTLDNPTYNRMGNHTEAVQVDYDPARIGYRELLSVFAGLHNPCSRAVSTQYKSAAFVHDEAQREAAAEVLQARAAEYGAPLRTVIIAANTFYLAEDYHQKYALRHYKVLWDELAAVYPDWRALNDSTVAARLNGFAYGYGTRALLVELESYGLSNLSREYLMRMANRLD